MISRFLPRLREEIEALRAASASTAQDRKPDELDQQSVGRLSRMDAMQQRAMANAIEARRGMRMRALEAAIRRIENGEFGLCNACGEVIEDKRLEFDPTMVRCRECATQS